MAEEKEKKKEQQEEHERKQEKGSKADTLAIFGEIIVAIGTKQEVINKISDIKKDLISDSIEIENIDLNGKCVVPGFIDAHLHSIWCIIVKTRINCNKITNYDALKKKIQEFIEESNIEKDEWIFVEKFDENKFEAPIDRKFPNSKILDEICKDYPLIIQRYDSHICFTNSKGLQTCGINKYNVALKTPRNGEIRVYPNGEPNGQFTDKAMDLITDLIPMPSLDIMSKASKNFSNELSSYGITSCGSIIHEKDVEIIKNLFNNGLIKQDLALYLVTDSLKTLKKTQNMFEKIKKIEKIDKKIDKKIGKKIGKFELNGLKRFLDGSFGAFTALMYKPFNDSPNKLRGLWATDKKKLKNQIKTAYSAGFDIITHVIGDKANFELIEIYREILDEIGEVKHNLDNYSRNARLRVDHGSILTAEVLNIISKTNEKLNRKKNKKLGEKPTILVVSQPEFIRSEHNWLEKRLGSERIKDTYPFRSIIEKGIILAGSSDAAVETPNVLMAIQDCVTRHGFIPEQSISVNDALKMYTINAAYAIGQENIKGSLEEGKLADFVVLDQDIRDVKPSEIDKIQILNTYHRGKKIY